MTSSLSTFYKKFDAAEQAGRCAMSARDGSKYHSCSAEDILRQWGNRDAGVRFHAFVERFFNRLIAKRGHAVGGEGDAGGDIGGGGTNTGSSSTRTSSTSSASSSDNDSSSGTSGSSSSGGGGGSSSGRSGSAGGARGGGDSEGLLGGVGGDGGGTGAVAASTTSADVPDATVWEDDCVCFTPFCIGGTQ